MTDLPKNGDRPVDTEFGGGSAVAVTAVGAVAAEAEKLRIRMAREALGAP